jgi:hypothetical protein
MGGTAVAVAGTGVGVRVAVGGTAVGETAGFSAAVVGGGSTGVAVGMDSEAQAAVTVKSNRALITKNSFR